LLILFEREKWRAREFFHRSLDSYRAQRVVPWGVGEDVRFRTHLPAACLPVGRDVANRTDLHGIFVLMENVSLAKISLIRENSRTNLFPNYRIIALPHYRITALKN